MGIFCLFKVNTFHLMSEESPVTAALQKVLKASMYNNNLAKGLNEACKALELDHTVDEQKAALCVLAEDCSEENYKKLIGGICKTWKISLLKVDSRSDLGRWCGLCKYDSSNVARKIRPCSCVVIKKWPENAELANAVNTLKSAVTTA